MKKLFVIILSFFTLFGSSFAIDIVTREQWGADPELAYLDSAQWQSILANSSGYTVSQREIDKYNFLLENYPKYFTYTSVIKNWGGRPLAANIQKIGTVRQIIIHHTADTYSSESRSEKEIMQSIYQYHAIHNRWGDIGYNYVIGPSGTVYEGRLGGDGTRGFHAKYNNEHSIGIALMGNFDLEKPTQLQIQSLVILITELKQKYNLGTTDDIYTFRDCLDGCSTGIQVRTLPWLIGHHDAGHTDCPGDYLDNWIAPLRTYFSAAG